MRSCNIFGFFIIHFLQYEDLPKIKIFERKFLRRASYLQFFLVDLPLDLRFKIKSMFVKVKPEYCIPSYLFTFNGLG